MFKDKYTRRTLLGRFGGSAAVAALTSFVPYTEADAAAGDKKRYCYLYTPVNPAASLVDPQLPTSTAEESNLNFRGTYESLNDMKNKMSLYRGLTNRARYDGDLGGGHKDSAMTMLTGVSCRKNKVIAGGTVLGEGNIGMGNGTSIDQFIAQENKKLGLTPISDLRFGWENSLGASDNVAKSNSFLNGKIMLRHQNPKAMFEQLFPFAGEVTQENSLGYRASILDTVNDELKKLQAKLTQNDRIRLEQHLNAIEEAQALVNASENMSALGCELPEENNNTFNNRMDLAVQAYIRMTAIAFSCDLTRVAGGQFLPYQGGNSYHQVRDFNLNGLGAKVNTTYHSATHGKGGAAADIKKFIEGVQEYRAKIYLDTLKALDQIPEANGGSILDNTVVHWYKEISKDHKAFDLFNLIGGGAGHFKMGKQFIVGSKTNQNNSAPQNMLLVSIANAMGYAINDFGEYKAGPIPAKYLA